MQTLVKSLKSVPELCTLIDEVAALKLVIAAKDSIPSSEPETEDESNFEADDEADDEADLKSDSENGPVRTNDASDNDNRHMTPDVPNSQPVTNNNKTESDRMTEGGYQMVGRVGKLSRVSLLSNTHSDFIGMVSLQLMTS